MSFGQTEIIVNVPAELTKKCQGLALDMGGSVLKFVFRTKEDFDLANSDDAALSRLHLVAVARSALQEGLDYVKENAYYNPEGASSDELKELYTTGIGCSEFGKVISQTLGVRLQNVMEFDCFAKSFVYLASRLSRHELLEPFNDDALLEPVELAKSQMLAFQDMGSKNLTQSIDFDLAASMSQQLMFSTGRPPAVDHLSEIALSKAEPDVFPSLLIMCGSGFGYIKINEDGTFKVVDGSTHGGKAFCGMGSLLTGCKTFDELIELASAGDQRHLDQYTSDIAATIQDDDSIYSKMINVNMAPTLLFSFGKAIGRQVGDFRREDVARAWLTYVIIDLVQNVQLTCLIQDVKRIFFCGGFCASPLVRQIITTEMARRNMFFGLMIQRPATITFDFIKPGQHLGALGCMINGMDKFIGN